MTHTPAGVELSPGAAARFEEYLRQVRAALAGVADVNPDEIEADIREHVENELHEALRPVPLLTLEAVLARLGPPSQWGATDDPGVFRRARALLGGRFRDARMTLGDRLRAARESLVRGPEDWRLAYLSFGVFALGVLTFFVLPLGLLVSYLLSRAGIALAREKGIELGAGRKWLLYPPLVTVSLVLLVAVLLWPALAGPAAFHQVDSAHRRVRDYDRPERLPITAQERQAYLSRQSWRDLHESQVEEDRKLLSAFPVPPSWAGTTAGWFVAVGAVSLWWVVLGLLAAGWPGAVRAALVPLCNGFARRHGLWLAVTCGAVLILWGVVAWELATAAGLIPS